MYFFIFYRRLKCKYLSLTGGKSKLVGDPNRKFTKGDIIGCGLDLTKLQISFSLNGEVVKGLFKDFNVDGLFFPVVSMSADVR